MQLSKLSLRRRRYSIRNPALKIGRFAVYWSDEFYAHRSPSGTTLTASKARATDAACFVGLRSAAAGAPRPHGTELGADIELVRGGCPAGGQHGGGDLLCRHVEDCLGNRDERGVRRYHGDRRAEVVALGLPVSDRLPGLGGVAVRGEDPVVAF